MGITFHIAYLLHSLHASTIPIELFGQSPFPLLFLVIPMNKLHGVNRFLWSSSSSLPRWGVFFLLFHDSGRGRLWIYPSWYWSHHQIIMNTKDQSKCTAWSGLHTNSGKFGFGSGGLQIVDFLNLWAYLAVHFALTPDNSDRSWIETCGITFERNGNNTPAVIIVFIDQDETTNFQQERWRV